MVARILGIDVVVHASWLFSIALLALYAKETFVDDLARGASPAEVWLASVTFALPLSACILFHELAHCLVARAYRLPVRRITMFIFGGVSQIEREAPGPAAEFSLALAGPLSSLVLAASLAGVARALNPGIRDLLGVWGAFAIFNLYLALFNLVPAFPMDGGRLLRSMLWAGARNRARATRWAVVAGRSFAFLLIGGGGTLTALAILTEASDATSGVWAALIGLFLFNAAGAAGRAEGGDRPNERWNEPADVPVGPPVPHPLDRAASRHDEATKR